MTDLGTAAQQALEYMKAVGQMDMYPAEWAIVERLEAALAQAPVAQALCEADRIMGHEDEATEWRQRWGHLFGVAGSTTSPWRESAAQGCSPGGTGMSATPPQTAEPVQEPVQCSNTFACRCPKHYTAPPQRKPLSNEELAAVTDEHWPDFVAFARAIEAAHGIKE